jgi:transposase
VGLAASHARERNVSYQRHRPEATALYELVRDNLETLYGAIDDGVLRAKRRTAIKILFADGTGMCLFYKRLDRHVFRVPESSLPDCTSIELSERELDDLLDGIDIERGPQARRGRRGRVH